MSSNQRPTVERATSYIKKIIPEFDGFDGAMILMAVIGDTLSITDDETQQDVGSFIAVGCTYAEVMRKVVQTVCTYYNVREERQRERLDREFQQDQEVVEFMSAFNV